jgi:acetyl esterase/lipase
MGFQRSWGTFLVVVAAIMARLVATTMAQTNPNRTVVEEGAGWLRVYSDGTVERLTPPGAEPFTAIVPPYAEPRGGVTVHDITTGHGVDVRLYLPEAAGESPHRRRPVLVHLHGGGFCVSRPSWALYHNFYAPLAAELGVAGIVSVYLPLAPEHRLPAAIDAGHSALLWLRDVAHGGSNVYGDGHSAAVERFGHAADFSRVFLIGDSSGGNLVHLVAARAGDEEKPGVLHPVKLAGGVLLHPGFAREQKSRSELENPPSMFLTPEMIDKLLALGLPMGVNKDGPYTSPELAAMAVAHVRMPPLLLMVAEKDLLHDPQLDYGKAIEHAGKKVETVVSRGDVAHIFYLNFFAVQSDQLTANRTKELVHTIKCFIDRH